MEKTIAKYVELAVKKLQVGLKEIYPNRTEKQIEYLVETIRKGMFSEEHHPNKIKTMKADLSAFNMCFERGAGGAKFDKSILLAIRISEEIQQEMDKAGYGKPSALH